MVAWREAALGFGKRDAQLLVLLGLVSVFEETSTICGEFEGAVVSQSGQRYDTLREAMRHILVCRRVCCLLEGKEVPALPGCNDSWI